MWYRIRNLLRYPEYKEVGSSLKGTTLLGLKEYATTGERGFMKLLFGHICLYFRRDEDLFREAIFLLLNYFRSDV